jgi:hypothetical protein
LPIADCRFQLLSISASQLLSLYPPIPSLESGKVGGKVVEFLKDDPTVRIIAAARSPDKAAFPGIPLVESHYSL